jgi:hypothetical protein
VPVSSVRVRGIEKVDIIRCGVGYFPGPPFAGGVRDTCLRGTGGRKGGARGGAARGGCRIRFGGHWRERRGEHRGGSVWRQEMHIFIKAWAHGIVYRIPAAKLASGGCGQFAFGVIPRGQLFERLWDDGTIWMG